jgi:hypothetical protein
MATKDGLLRIAARYWPSSERGQLVSPSISCPPWHDSCKCTRLVNSDLDRQQELRCLQAPNMNLRELRACNNKDGADHGSQRYRLEVASGTCSLSEQAKQRCNHAGDPPSVGEPGVIGRRQHPARHKPPWYLRLMQRCPSSELQAPPPAPAARLIKPIESQLYLYQKLETDIDRN